MIFVFLHGSFSTPEDAWWPWLRRKLEEDGHKVLAPQFPVDKWVDVGTLNPRDYRPKFNLNDWFKRFDEIKDLVLGDKERFFVGHSLGPLFLLHLLERYKLDIKGAVLVAPFFEFYGKSAIVEKFNQPFYQKDFDFTKLKSLIRKSTVIFSDNDPYVDNQKSLDFAKKLGSRVVKVHGLGHMGLESELLEFPVILEVVKELNN